jgi:hypothetical protein
LPVLATSANHYNTILYGSKPPESAEQAIYCAAMRPAKFIHAVQIAQFNRQKRICRKYREVKETEEKETSEGDYMD